LVSAGGAKKTLVVREENYGNTERRRICGRKGSSLEKVVNREGPRGGGKILSCQLKDSACLQQEERGEELESFDGGTRFRKQSPEVEKADFFAVCKVGK